MGVPVRMHYLSDLVEGKVPPCRVYIFLNPFWVRGQRRRAVRRAIDDRTAVFFYGSGFLSNRPGTEGITDLTGLPVRRIQPGPGRATFIESECPLLDGVSGTTFGTRARLSPLWAVRNTERVTPLARNSGGKLLAASARAERGLRVYVGTTGVPVRFLRNVLQQSGITPVMRTGGVVERTGNFLAVTATRAGEKNINLRRKTDIRSLFGSLKRANVRNLSLQMEEGETLLFRTGQAPQ